MRSRKRSCGPCTLCCTLQGVKEGLSAPKLPGVPCEHLAACGGCSIYERRPIECALFACEWLDGMGQSLDRPDRLGVMFETQETTTRFILARSRTPGQTRKARVKKLLRRFIRMGLPVGIADAETFPEDLNEPGEVTVYTDESELP